MQIPTISGGPLGERSIFFFWANHGDPYGVAMPPTELSRKTICPIHAEPVHCSIESVKIVLSIIMLNGKRDSTITEEIEIKISDNIVIPGSEPIVILGPNGSGKTRHAVSMANMNNANMIAALRNIAMPSDVVMRSIDQAQSRLKDRLASRHSRPWELSNEINELFSKLMAEDSASAIKFRDQHETDSSVEPETTKLMRLSKVWEHLFPGRHIEFTGYNPKVRSEYNIPSGEYSAQQMSDGERVALYLAGRVLDAEQKVIIVDEPEVHFHSRLASRFWNELQNMRHDCRFVYITHDLAFALSRVNATFVIIKPNQDPQQISLQEGIPQDLAESLLAAASFSIHAKRIVFCEGNEGNSRDQMLYSAWFNGIDTAVVPVGSSKDVVRCSSAFDESRLVAGVQSIGIIDRDYWPQRFFDSLPQSVNVLGVHEIENLFCLKKIILSVAEHLGKEAQDSSDCYEKFINKAQSMFTGGLLNKQISERYKRRCEHEFNIALNNLKATEDLASVEQEHLQAGDSGNWENSPSVLFSEEKETLIDALQAGEEKIMRYFPGKVFLKYAAESLGMKTDSYVELVCNALVANDDGPFTELRNKLEECLSEYLPQREVSTTV
ncbi:MAG: AAA family ATPase [Phycisphaerae bacterium]|nr:AAA family ATPase [Phycisphaerae bacterium]